jgi:hypothetical protein
MKFKKLVLIIIITACLLTCTPEKEVMQSNELVVSKLDVSLSGSLNHLFKINLDSLHNTANEVTDIYGEKHILKKQKNRSGMTNDYYLWGSFSSKTDHSLLTRGKRAIRREDKSFFWNYFLEFVPDSLQLSFFSINTDSLECHFFYNHPFRDGGVTGLNWLMYDKVLNKYFYGEAIGQYVKSPENGLEVELLEGPSFVYFIREKIKDYRGKTITFPFTGYVSYVVIQNKTTNDILSDRFFRDGFNKTSNKKDLDNTRKWIVDVTNELFKDQYLENLQIDTLYFRYIDFGKNRSDGKDEGYKQVILACDKTNVNNVLFEINYSDFYGKNKSKYIYNPLE